MFRNRKLLEKIMVGVMILVVFSMIVALFGPGLMSK